VKWGDYMTKEEIIVEAKKEKVRYLKLLLTDMLGRVKSVEIPASKLKEALNGEIGFDGSSIEGFVRIKEADMYLIPDLDTWTILPLESSKELGKTAQLFCDVEDYHHNKFVGSPRGVLKNALEEMEKMGFKHFNVGVEPEFYLFKKDEQGNLIYSDNGSYFDMAPLGNDESIRHEIVIELEKLGFNVDVSHHEVGPGQNEVNFKYDDALKTCDRIQTYKQVVKQVALKHGLIASFMPKPIVGIAGSGMHTNCSLFDDNGNNLFYDPHEENGLSKLCLYWISGILNRAREISAITNPTVNSYKRLVPGYEAPCYICWSDNNRSAMIRIPASRGKATRTEVRNVDPTANPYLMCAVILRAGLEGIKNKETIIKPSYDNIFALTREEREKQGIKNLPENLKDAIKEMKHSSFVKEVLGEHIFNKYIEAKQLEWKEYKVLVTDWEIKKYL
jgi:glutamine synthetase